MTLTPEQRRDWAQDKIQETTWPHTVWPAIARWLELTDDNFEVVEAAINVGVAGGNPQGVISFYLQTWRVKVEAAKSRAEREALIRDILETGDAGLSKKPILLRNTTGGRNMTRSERRRQEQEQRRQAKRRRRPLTIQVILDDDQAVTAAAAAEEKEETDGPQQ